jgi:hypothetical protein
MSPDSVHLMQGPPVRMDFLYVPLVTIIAEGTKKIRAVILFFERTGNVRAY